MASLARSAEKNFSTEKSLLTSHTVAHAIRSHKQFMEDDYSVVTNTDGNVVLVGVYDGHGGLYGKVAANTIVSCLEQFAVSNDQEFKTWNPATYSERIGQFFIDTHSAIRTAICEKNSTYTVDALGIIRDAWGTAIHGGSTCTICCIFTDETSGSNEKYILTANVGDSDALLVQGSQAIPLSASHKPSTESEYARIKSLGTGLRHVYHTHGYPNIFEADGSKVQKYVTNPWGNGLQTGNVRYEPSTYVTADGQDAIKLAMTRSLGDFYCQPLGVSHIPTISIQQLNKELEYSLVVASDGMWDCWLDAEIVALANTDLQDLDTTIMTKVMSLFKTTHDDVTFVFQKISASA